MNYDLAGDLASAAWGLVNEIGKGPDSERLEGSKAMRQLRQVLEGVPLSYAVNPVFEFLHGKTYVHNGVSGMFEHDLHVARYPYERVVEKLSHEPDDTGRRTKAYRDTKKRLGDDWSTDLTDSIETYCAIALELGYKEVS